MIVTLIVSAAAVLVFMGVFSPFETLGWWAGWYGERPGERELPPDVPETRAGQFVVYLTGIGGTSPTEYDALEQNFLAELKARLSSSEPATELVDDVLPYASNNKALTGERGFSWFWRRLRNLKGHGAVGAISFLINIRNLWQVLVSSDSRFGPLYNYATAQHVLGKLLAHGYPLGLGVPITIIGYSGGGQIAVGAAPLLEESTAAPVYVISLGGVMSSGENIPKLGGLTHLYGAKDSVQRLGYLFFPGRWPFLPWTAWNRARKAGIITKVPLGPMVHTGAGGYLDPEAKLKNGQSYLDKTLDVMTELIGKAELQKPALETGLEETGLEETEPKKTDKVSEKGV